jgi:hypothetical protein
MNAIQTQSVLPSPSSAPRASGPAAAGAASPQPAPSGDQVSLSNGAQSVNPYEGHYDAATVTVDRWKHGKNDCLERILLNQGFSRAQIYGKHDGKSLLQLTAEANNLKDPNLIRTGQQLVVPSNLKPEQPSQHVEMSTDDLQPGEAESARVGSPQASITAAVARAEDGSSGSMVTTRPAESEASLSTTTTVSPKGTIDVEADPVSPTRSTATQVSTSGDETAQTTVDTAVTPNQSTVHVQDTDATPNNLQVDVQDGHVVTVNPARTQGDEVKTDTDISAAHENGLGARSGRWLNDHILGADPDARLHVDGASDVAIDKGDDGSARVTVTDGQGHAQTVTNPGQSWLERRGEDVDHAADWVGDKASQAGTWVSDEVSQAWHWLRGQ